SLSSFFRLMLSARIPLLDLPPIQCAPLQAAFLDQRHNCGLLCHRSRYPRVPPQPKCGPPTTLQCSQVHFPIASSLSGSQVRRMPKCNIYFNLWLSAFAIS
ncbi:hypothetical protein BC826DRAFT_1021983, partial [Russula brevipes]